MDFLYKKGTPKVIAEIGCNHKGNMDIAKEAIITAATFCKANVVKFQKRTNKELLTKKQYNEPHPNPHNSYGKTYGEHREFLEFNLAQHRQLKQWCEDFGATYSTSIWDLTSAQEITSLQPKMIKILYSFAPKTTFLKPLMIVIFDVASKAVQLAFSTFTSQERGNKTPPLP